MFPYKESFIEPYWFRVEDSLEPHYSLGVLNSETAHRAAEHLQSCGQWGACDFDKVMLSLPMVWRQSFLRSDRNIRLVEGTSQYAALSATLLPKYEAQSREKRKNRPHLCLRKED